MTETEKVTIQASERRAGPPGQISQIELKGAVMIDGTLTVKNSERPRLRATRLWNSLNALLSGTTATLSRGEERKNRILSLMVRTGLARDRAGLAHLPPNEVPDELASCEDALSDLDAEIAEEAGLAFEDDETRKRYKGLKLQKLEGEAMAAQYGLRMEQEIAMEEARHRLLTLKASNAKLEHEIEAVAGVGR